MHRSFSSLLPILGRPARTFTYTNELHPPISDHVWRCGCAAREYFDGKCATEPCGKHDHLRERARYAERNPA